MPWAILKPPKAIPSETSTAGKAILAIGFKMSCNVQKN